ncbi:DUF366 family protein [Bdellovibrio sp. HCB274]|uniref:DUF366 family protein n=1 Tax=Bdellovibrio sp. HCB274 TaxID=3394361 RepID=UPI0039B59252
MEMHFIEKKFAYDGSQLHSLFAYLEHGKLGPSIVSWVGQCDIPAAHMVDGEDLLANAVIAGDEMLHFIIEVFDRDLFSGVALQRLFAAIARDYVQKHGAAYLKLDVLIRDGDDIYWGDRKLSISIATRSPVSTMVHFAMNVTNEGTPVKTACLGDFKLDPRKTAQDLMALFKQEFQSITVATQKVRPVP